MNGLIKVVSASDVPAETPDRLSAFVDILLREYIALHEFVKGHTPCNDRVKAYRFKKELPRRVQAFGEALQNTGLGLEATVEYHEDRQSIKPHRKNLWIRFVEVAGYAPCPVKLRFDYSPSGINEGIRQMLDWANLAVDCYSPGLFSLFSVKKEEAITMPDWVYQFLESSSPSVAKLSDSTELGRPQRSLARYSFTVQKGGCGEEGMNYITLEIGHQSGLKPHLVVDTFRSGKANLVGMLTPVNLAQYRTQEKKEKTSSS